uniref:Transposase n=1 Tax=Globodera rostochiensis TaxID=31243 RepID=A0A914HSD2_GLORO
MKYSEKAGGTKAKPPNLKMPAPTNFGQNVHHQIDRQNTQIGQIEPNSTDQLGQIDPKTEQNPPLTESDHSGQIEPNSSDQNPPLTESDHSGQIEPNSTDQNAHLTESDHSDYAEDEQKRNIIDKFQAMKDEFKQKGKFSAKEWNQIEEKIAKHLKVNRSKIYEWKKEFGLSRKAFYAEEERKHLVEKFNEMKAELTQAGLKNSYSNQIDEIVAKELGISFVTIYKWKSELGQIEPKHKHPHSKQMELMKRYYEIKDQIPKIIDKDIAKILKIGSATLVRWKRQFKRQQFHPNSVDGHSVEENAAANVQEIENITSGSI